MNNLAKHVENVSSQLFGMFMFSLFFPCINFCICFLNLKKSKVLIYLEITHFHPWVLLWFIVLFNEEFIFVIVNVYFKCNRFSFS